MGRQTRRSRQAGLHTALGEQERRPQEFLDTGTARGDTSPAAQQASPFLALPPEIRNRIYRFALGGRTIHVRRPRIRYTRVRLWYCTARISDGAAAAAVRSGTASDSTLTRTYMHRHENCQPYYSTTRFVSGDLPLALLSTCRQIHLEAAAFPFKSNVFTCADGEGFKELLKWLSAAQKASISEIVFEGMLHPRNYIPWIASLKELRGLRSLTIFTWVYRWPSTAAQVLHLAQIAFQRAFPPTERSRSDTFTSVNFCFEELSRGLKGGADNEAIANFRDEVEELLKGG